MIDRLQPALAVLQSITTLQALGSDAGAKLGRDGDATDAQADALSAAMETSEVSDEIEEEATTEDSGERPELTSIVRAYLETLEPEEEQEERFSMVL